RRDEDRLEEHRPEPARRGRVESDRGAGALCKTADRRPAARRARDRQSGAGRRRLGRGLLVAHQRRDSGPCRIPRRPFRRGLRSRRGPVGVHQYRLCRAGGRARPLRLSARDRRGHVRPRALRPHRLRRAGGDGEVRRLTLTPALSRIARRETGVFRRPLRERGRVPFSRLREKVAAAQRGRMRAMAPRLARPILLALAALALVLAAGVAATLAWQNYEVSLGPLDLAASREGSTVVVDRDGRLLRPFTLPDGRWRLPATTHEVDPRYVAMLVAYEDGRFYEHRGVDARALLRAGAQWLSRGHVVSGGSTLAMQVARLTEPRPERSLAAKLRQIARALQIERAVGREGVLDRYLTTAPFGGNLEGVRAASLAYFGKEPLKLTIAEAALLVALPQSPEARRPDRSAKAARAARDRVLARVAARGVISPDDAEAAKREPVPEARKPFPQLAAHAAEEAFAAEPHARAIRLSIDARLQAKLEALAKESAARL